MNILSFHNVSLNVAGNQILEQVTWQVHRGDRIALVGRNGAGKSTLLKLILGEINQDSGDIKKQKNLRLAGLTQEITLHNDWCVYAVLVKELGAAGKALLACHERSLNHSSEEETLLIECQQQLDELQAWDLQHQVNTMVTRLGIDKNASMSALSGGMKRRVFLAAVLIASPDLLILDEPTNHLDIEAIEWLESFLRTYAGTLLVVTHDRAFLSRVANCIVEIDRGRLYGFNCGYESYLDRREAMRMAEQKEHDLFDKRLSKEEAWIRQGVKARRTRNEGRVRALKAMREAYRIRRMEMGKINKLSVDVARSGQLVLEAKHLQFSMNGKILLRDFSCLLTRGDKVGIIGPNGCGKTSLVRLLLGELTPDAGQIRQGTSLSIAYFDQLRHDLDDEKTVMQNVADGADFVSIQGKQTHVASYLRDFLFLPQDFQRPVFSLSGGERNRLLLAKLFAKPANFLVMDEPTNDLDMETLELLESMLLHYSGTLLLISHDRALINQVVTSVLVYEGDGHFYEGMGDYSDYCATRKKKQEAPKKSQPIRKNNADKLNFKEQRELKQLPLNIESLEQKIQTLQADLAAPEFYQQNRHATGDIQKQLSDYEAKLSELYIRWELLENKRG